MGDSVLIERDEEIATVTVNRPEKRNSMDVETRIQLREAFEALETDDEIRVVVLRGAGEGSFIAGGDIERFSEYDLLEGLTYMTEHAQGLYTYIFEFPKPTIAAIDGYAFGGGTEVALACDVRVGNADATFGLPEVRIGLLPSGGGTQRLAQIVGAGIAKELILTGRSVDAQEARDIGLLNHLYEDEHFEAETRALATALASNAPIAQMLAKESINLALETEGLDFERIAGAFLFGTEDQTEGTTAFLEGRDPNFTGE